MGVLAALAALAVFIPASAAPAATVTLGGDWAPFTRCPVDDPAMLAADGTSSVAFCVASDSPSGSIKIGNITAPTQDTNLQLGLVENTSTGAFSVVAPSGGAIVTAPIQVPGGLLGLMCPSNIPVVSAVCQQITSSRLNAVTAVVQPAGNPSGFSLAAGLGTGTPIVTVPVKIQLRNPLLGPDCYLGSNSHPILLHPQNLTTPQVSSEQFDANGTPDPSGVMFALVTTGGTQGDSSAAIPGATGCGLLGLLDFAVDLKVGLPSAAGNNTVTLNNASAYLVGLNDPAAAAPSDGKDLSSYWHSAVRS
ncbi:MAG: hypothetical protein JOY82_17140 [Streptosporangiaceae bacterium]|nr:hypothetical protein [Streptosporangiaceae bacterium]MBV9856218.1 hypothetical protein [Streptosporangiaceae bacterium]